MTRSRQVNTHGLPPHADGKERACAFVTELVQKFEHSESDYMQTGYNETQTRTEFVTPLLEAFGWDVHNKRHQALAYRDVIQESSVDVDQEKLSKRPDYELRLSRQRKLFVEAKKPSVNISKDRSSAFQTRRYGYSASLPISIVTNFRQMAVYDCQIKPDQTDEAYVARLHFFHYKEFTSCFDELWELLSHESIYSGRFDRQFNIDVTRRGAEQFDDYFLVQIRDWRSRLAVDISSNSPGLSSEELTYAVQRFLTRIIFLRICEDREIEKYETLKNLSEEGTFDKLIEILHHADKFYDSGIFSLIDDEPLGIRVSDSTLHDIIAELYYPSSPYAFSVVKTEVLGEIYEQFLGEIINIDNGEVDVVYRPEIKESGGVVPTPDFIAYTIVSRSLKPLLLNKTPKDLNNFTLADICCGSGIFLLSAYECLMDYYLDWYVNDGPEKHNGKRIYESGDGSWHLTFDEKRRILVNHIRGVDIDVNAVEVAQFSLFLKLIENEGDLALKDYVRRSKNPVLPDLSSNIQCGNSLIGLSDWNSLYSSMREDQYKIINPFDWEEAFPNEIENGGFDVIVGNPPYIRIQKMVAYTPQEVDYYSDLCSPYSVAHVEYFDKYALFLERYLALTKNQGRVGVIIPHKFMSIVSGNALRKLLTEKPILEEIIHFGAEQVFGRGISNYTCVLIINKTECEQVRVEHVDCLEKWRYDNQGDVTIKHSDKFGEEPWSFDEDKVQLLFSRVRDESPSRLDEIANIGVGVQTSADKIYIIQGTPDNDNFISVSHDEKEWSIERAILRPCLHRSHFEAFENLKANTWIIFPYEIESVPNGRLRARLLQPDELASNYPGAWAYLNAHRSVLEDRGISGGAATERQWYQYGRSQSLTRFEQPKIVMPVLSLEARYAYDDGNVLFTGGGNGPYYMIKARNNAPVSTLYLLGILNHPLCEAMIRSHTSVFRGGYYSHGKQFIKDLPIPIPSESTVKAIEKQVKKVMAAVNALETARTSHDRDRSMRKVKSVRNELELEVNAVFGIFPDDLSTILSVSIPR